MTRGKVFITPAIVLLGAGIVAATWYVRRDRGLTVTIDVVRTRDLEAVVSASGKIQPKRLVNISADSPGRVVDLAVNEGDRINKGQFLLQIDPKSLSTRVDSGTASLYAAQMSLDQMRQAVKTTRVQLDQAQQTLQRQQELWSKQLTPRNELDQAMSDVRTAESALQEREHAANAQASRITQERAGLASARYDLAKVRIESPIDGIVTRRNIQEGETAVTGTMNNAGTILLTLADMSVIQAEVEVDETSIPSVNVGQKATIIIDAFPDRAFSGHVTEIGNSPIRSTGTAGATTQATNFKVVVVLDEEVPDVRPGFTAIADIVTATRAGAVAVPIPAVAVRELVYDANGRIIREPGRERGSAPTRDAAAHLAEPEPSQTRRETEGVFALRGGRAEFVPIKVGIAGDRYFEVLSGLKVGDQVITGPYNSVRSMADGDEVKVDAKK